VFVSEDVTCSQRADDQFSLFAKVVRNCTVILLNLFDEDLDSFGFRAFLLEFEVSNKCRCTAFQNWYLVDASLLLLGDFAWSFEIVDFSGLDAAAMCCFFEIFDRDVPLLFVGDEHFANVLEQRHAVIDNLFGLKEPAVLRQFGFGMNDAVVTETAHCHIELAASEKCFGFFDACARLLDVTIEFSTDALRNFADSADVFLEVLGSMDDGSKYCVGGSSSG